MILAATVDPQALWQFLNVLGFLGGLAGTLVALWSRTHVQRREISFTREYASKEELMHVAKDIERLEKKLDQMGVENKADRQLIMTAADARFEKVVSRVDRLLEGVSRLQGVKDSQS